MQKEVHNDHSPIFFFFAKPALNAYYLPLNTGCQLVSIYTIGQLFLWFNIQISLPIDSNTEYKKRLLQWYSNVGISWFYFGNINQTLILSLFSNHHSFLACGVCLINFLYLVCFYTRLTPLYTKDYTKTVTKTKNFS